MEDDTNNGWSCLMCTFFNHGLLNQCEMCDSKRATTTTALHEPPLRRLPRRRIQDAKNSIFSFASQAQQALKSTMSKGKYEVLPSSDCLQELRVLHVALNTKCVPKVAVYESLYSCDFGKLYLVTISTIKPYRVKTMLENPVGGYP